MNIYRASAPGSAMLTGEHAVLFGHRAIVCAVEQRASVTITPRVDDTVFIRSILGSLITKRQHLTKYTSDNLSFVLAALKQFSFNSGFEIDISSEIDSTLGLGSSAAVTIATVSVCKQFTQSDIDLYETSLRVIHQVQGRGSGADLAASLTGGMIGYSIALNGRKPNIKRLDQQTNALPHFSLHYAGYKKKTADVLKLVAEKTNDFPELYSKVYVLMHQVSERIETAINDADWQAMGKLMNMYQGLMDTLGVNDKKLSEIVYNLRAEQSVLGSKISGSGLGDCVIALHESGTNISRNVQFNIAKKGLTEHL